MQEYHEVLPERKSSKHSGIRWTPAEGEYSPSAGLLVIDTDRSRVEYLVTEFTPGWKGRAFTLAKVTSGTDAESESYDVFCAADRPAADSCDCKGFTYKHTCKHVDACRALIVNKWI